MDASVPDEIVGKIRLIYIYYTTPDSMTNIFICIHICMLSILLQTSESKSVFHYD